MCIRDRCTHGSPSAHDQPPGYGSPLHVKYSDILDHTTNPQDTDLRVHTRPTLRIRISAARQIFRYFRTIMRRISPPGAFYVRTRRTYVCMPYPASSTPISTAAAHLRSSQKQRTSPRLHRVSFSQCCRPGMIPVRGPTKTLPVLEGHTTHTVCSTQSHARAPHDAHHTKYGHG